MSTTALVPQKNSAIKTSDLKSYSVLKSRVSERLALGRKRAEAELVHTYWDVGCMINTHVQIHKGRAEYGQQVVKKLAEDIEIDPTVLWKIAKFPKAFRILAPGRVLPWSHYRALLTVDDNKKRKSLAEQAEKKNWTKEELEVHIQKLKGLASGNHRPKKSELAVLEAPVLGALHTYRIFQLKSIDAHVKLPLKIDLGFQVYIDLNRARAPHGLKEGDIVSLEAGRHSHPGSVILAAPTAQHRNTKRPTGARSSGAEAEIQSRVNPSRNPRSWAPAFAGDRKRVV